MNNTLETIFTLDVMRTRRELSLERATRDLLWEESINPLIDVSDIVMDNRETDKDMIRHFSGEYPTTSPDLHTRACEDSGVCYCICMANKKIQGGLI